MQELFLLLLLLLLLVVVVVVVVKCLNSVRHPKSVLWFVMFSKIVLSSNSPTSGIFAVTVVYFVGCEKVEFS